LESKSGADFRSLKPESFLHDTRSESRFRFSTPKIGTGFRPRVSLALTLQRQESCRSEAVGERVWKGVPFYRTSNRESSTTKRAVTVSWNHQCYS